MEQIPPCAWDDASSSDASVAIRGEDDIPEERGGRQELDGKERSEEHTSELQSQSNLVCRLLLEKKNNVERIGWALEYFKERFYLQAGSKLTAEKRETTFGPPGTDVAINFPNIDHTICAVPVNRV